MPGQQMDISRPLAQWRQLHAKHVNPEKQVGAKLSFVHEGSEIVIRRSNQPHIRIAKGLRSQGAICPFLHQPQ